MSGKKASSQTPSELNENWGSNYMMDGFWHDMEYEHGLKDNPGANPVPQPNTSGMSHLPGGVIVGEDTEFNELPVPEGVLREEEGGLDLGELGIVASVLSNIDRTDSGITSFSWLWDAQQDPDRLPSNPVDNVIPELQEAWGNRTDGINRIDLVERSSVQYQDSFQGPEDDDIQNKEKLASLVQSAMRHSAAGDFAFAQKCKLHPKMVRAMVAIEKEHGLVGKVYVRASAYPKLHRGKYAKEFKKAAKGCRYLIAEDTPFNRDVANMLHLALVPVTASIDWRRVYDQYARGLSATGRLKAAGGHRDLPSSKMREVLRRAFLGHEVAPRTTIEPARPRVAMPADQVSTEEAHQALTTFKSSTREVINWVQRAKKAEAEQVIKKLGGLVQARLLSKEDVDQLIRSKAPPNEILRTAAHIISSAKNGTYDGAGRNRVFHALKQGSRVTRKDWEEGLRNRAKDVLAQDRVLLVDNVTKMVTAGVLTQVQANTLLATNTNSRVAMRAASKIASTTRTAKYDQGTARHMGSAPSSTDADPAAIARHTKEVEAGREVLAAKALEVNRVAQVRQAKVEALLLKVGRIEQLVEDGISQSKLKKAVKANFSFDELKVIYTRLDPILVRGGFYEKHANNQYEGAVLTRAQQMTPDMVVSPKEIRKAARWLRQTMSEGSAGTELDQLIKIRISSKTVSASKERIEKLRGCHEGLSGHLYVDAGAYASKTGTKGCDKGALRHRANQLKYVLAMKQCAGCVSKNVDGVCQKYNKVVVDKVEQTPVDVATYQREALASHSTPDHELTAALFSDPSLQAAIAATPGAEFGLHNSALDNVESEAPEITRIDDIFFGGFEL